MKKLRFLQLLLVAGGIMLSSIAAAQSCATVNSATVTCTTPCATLTANNPFPPLAATTTYAVSSIPYTPQSYTAGTNAFPTSRDDEFSPLVPIGFTFCYFGNSYTQVCVGANGQVNFRAGMAGAASGYVISTQIPNNDAGTRGCIMGPHHDIDPRVSGSTIKYITVGVAPCRMFIVSWNNCGMYNCNSLKATQQIILYETTNIIEINIANKPVCGSWNPGPGYAQTGIEDLPGTVAYAAPGENSPPTWPAVSNESWRFTPTGPTTPWTYTWTDASGTVIGNTLSVSVCPATTTNYTFTMTNPSCAGATIVLPTTVTVGQLLSPITGPTSVCAGGTIALSDTAVGGTWTSTNNAVATISSSGVVTGVTPGVTVISYTRGLCSATQSVTVTTIPITGVPATCARGTTQLSNPVTGGVWSIIPATVATIDASSGLVYGVDPPGTSGGGGNAVVTYTNPLGCKSTYSVTINPTPPIPNLSGNPTAYCQYFTPALQLTVSAVSGVTPTWYVNNDTNGLATAPTPSTLTPGADTFSVRYTSIYGCVGDLGTMIVTVDPKPTPPTAFGKAYCEGETNLVPLDQQVSNYTGSLVWFDGNGVQLAGVPPVNSSVVDYPTGTTWFVSQQITITATCRSDSVAITDTIKNVPDFNIDTREWICQKDSMMLRWQNMGMSIAPTYYWQLPDDAAFAGTSVATDKDVLVKFDSFHMHNFVYLTVSDLGCVATDTQDIRVVALPTASSKTKNDVCMSDTATLALSARSSGATKFAWLIDGIPMFSSGALMVSSANSNEGGPFRVQWLDTGKHVIQLQTSTEEGCTSLPVRDTVNVHALPVSSWKFKPIRDNLCLDDSVRFVADDSMNAANLYVWAPAHSFNNVNSPVIYGRVEQPHQVIKLTVTDPFGCVSTFDRELDPQPCCLVPFPNAFSPNGDGHNDVFRPIQMGNYHRYHFFRIANRWGQTIFSSTDNQIAAWDGTMNGVPQDIGVYYYYLKYDCDGKLMEVKGDVTLVK